MGDELGPSKQPSHIFILQEQSTSFEGLNIENVCTIKKLFFPNMGLSSP